MISDCFLVVLLLQRLFASFTLVIFALVRRMLGVVSKAVSTTIWPGARQTDATKPLFRNGLIERIAAPAKVMRIVPAVIDSRHRYLSFTRFVTSSSMP